MDKRVIFFTVGGAVCGALAGVVGARFYQHRKESDAFDDIADEEVTSARDILEKKNWASFENDLVERVTANVKDAFTLYSDSVTKVSEDAMYKWMKQNDVETPVDLLWYPEDELLGELLDENYTGERLVEADREDILAAWTEELRLTPSVTQACYIFDGEAFRVSLAEGSFAAAYDVINGPDVAIYPME